MLVSTLKPRFNGKSFVAHFPQYRIFPLQQCPQNRAFSVHISIYVFTSVGLVEDCDVLDVFFGPGGVVSQWPFHWKSDLRRSSAPVKASHLMRNWHAYFGLFRAILLTSSVPYKYAPDRYSISLIFPVKITCTTILIPSLQKFIRVMHRFL